MSVKSPFACEECGVVGVGLARRGKPRRFCGAICYAASRSRLGRPEIVREANTACAHCAKAFYVGEARKRGGKRFCSNACRGAWQSALPFADWRGKLSANRENRARGERNGMFGVSPPHPGKLQPYVRKDGSIVNLRSTWEVAVAVYLDRLGMAWEYEPKRFRLANSTYVPDFYLPEQGVFWEVKGWFHKAAQAKIGEFRDAYPDENLVVITQPVYRLIANDNAKYLEEAA